MCCCSLCHTLKALCCWVAYLLFGFNFVCAYDWLPYHTHVTMALVGPSAVCCKLQLRSPHIPCVCLLDALYADGFMHMKQLVNHSRKSGKFFDGRNIPGNRSYLQAVLMSHEIFAKGTTVFKSNRPQAWYSLLMRSGGPIDNKMSGKACTTALKALTGDVVSSMLAALPPPVKPQAVEHALPVEDTMVDGDEGDAIPILDGDQRSQSSSSSSSSSPSSNHSQVDGDDEADFYVPQRINGARCHMEKHLGSLDDGLRLLCPYHPNCKKIRSLRRGAARLGSKAAFYFLGAWLDGHAQHPDDHQKWSPSAAEIRRFIYKNS
jgi:hypothetical protein